MTRDTGLAKQPGVESGVVIDGLTVASLKACMDAVIFR